MLGTPHWGRQRGKLQQYYNMKTFVLMLIASVAGSLIALYIAYKYVASQVASNSTATEVAGAAGAASSLLNTIAGI